MSLRYIFCIYSSVLAHSLSNHHHDDVHYISNSNVGVDDDSKTLMSV